MSKPVKEMILADYQERFNDVTAALVIDVRGITANENNELRRSLQAKDIKVTVLRNTLARKAFAGTSLEPLTPTLEGPSALAYGAESVVDVARALVEWARKIDALDLKAAVLDGQYFEGAKAVEQLSKYPTRGEALGQVVQLIFSPASDLVGCATAPGANLLAVVEALIEKLEKGEQVTK